MVTTVPLDFISTALDAYYTVALASTLLLHHNRERARRLTRIYGYTEVIYDPNKAIHPRRRALGSDSIGVSNS